MFYSICYPCAQAMAGNLITYKHNAVILWAGRRWIKSKQIQKTSLASHVHLEDKNPDKSSTSTHPSAGSSIIS